MGSCQGGRESRQALLNGRAAQTIDGSVLEADGDEGVGREEPAKRGAIAALEGGNKRLQRVTNARLD